MICTKEKNALGSLTESFDLSFCTAHGDIPWEKLLASMKKRGKIIMPVFADIALNATDFLFMN